MDTGKGRARHSVRAVVANQRAFVGKQRRAEDCPPYLCAKRPGVRQSSGALFDPFEYHGELVDPSAGTPGSAELFTRIVMREFSAFRVSSFIVMRSAENVPFVVSITTLLPSAVKVIPVAGSGLSCCELFDVCDSGSTVSPTTFTCVCCLCFSETLWNYTQW